MLISQMYSIQDEYKEMTGEQLLDALTCLNTIDCVYCDVYSNGTPKWYVRSDNIQHITNMIWEQKPAQQQQQQPQQYNRQYHQQQQQQQKPQHVLDDSINSNDCFFKDNVIYKLR